MNRLICNFPDCDCQLTRTTWQPSRCPMETTNAVHHRVLSWHPGGDHGAIRLGEREVMPGDRCPDDDDAFHVPSHLHVRETLDASDVLHRRVLAVLAGLAIGSCVVLLWAVLT